MKPTYRRAPSNERACRVFIGVHTVVLLLHLPACSFYITVHKYTGGAVGRVCGQPTRGRGSIQALGDASGGVSDTISCAIHNYLLLLLLLLLLLQYCGRAD